ncbi:hypothetical protein [Brevibacillus sp. HD3.3A]|uniref:hypothetical protein n=1 Tax=Brevibacillus sp. HD3.3A TaxID=2738979 RepID=UPI00156B9BF4|nr:hypothetical protein [Brevibacillus sp. HD3.3A]UED72131.1 hypothetical protein HP435_28920 [Brevibacillus sp. HD3.3A]
MSQWAENIQAFWHGDWREYIAWKGSHQILVYPTDEHPGPPSHVIQYTKRIETLEDFNDALQNGKWLKATYEETEEPI